MSVAIARTIDHIRPMILNRFIPVIAALWVVAALSSTPSFAQSGNAESEEASAPAVKVLPPAYDAQMMRLSEILGALHYLRELCGAKEEQQWREQMSNLIEKEEPTQERRAQMIARFNRGFRGYQETYRECTPAAIEANDRFLFEGAKLAGEIPGRYGR